MDRYDTLPGIFSLGYFGYYLDFVLAPLGASALIVAALWCGLSLALSIALVIGGVVAWSLAEYLIHRFAFHDLPALRRMHDVHHSHPKDLIGVASWGVFAAVAAIWLVLAIGLGAAVASAAIAGVLLGYLFYIVIHDRYHHSDRSRFGRYVAFMERVHAGHHRGGETNFGVSSPIWDFVFRTYRPI